MRGLRTKSMRGSKVVVLNVCRFEHAERRYKGIDVYAELAKRFRETHPALAGRMEFVLCGNDKDDVREVEALGCRCHPTSPTRNSSISMPPPTSI